MKDRAARLEALLHGLMKDGGALGAAIVSRDGLCVKFVGMQPLGRETVSAMTATLMGAAEIAVGEVDGHRPRHVVARADRVQLVVTGATPDLLLVAAADAAAGLDGFLPRVEAAAAEIAAIVAG